MDIREYARKTFPVNAVQVTLENVREVAEWCKGTVEMVPTRILGTVTDLPVVKMKGQGDNRGRDFTASLGSWIVELKGSFRVYKPVQFDESFEEIKKDSTGEPELDQQELPYDEQLSNISDDQVSAQL